MVRTIILNMKFCLSCNTRYFTDQSIQFEKSLSLPYVYKIDADELNAERNFKIP